MHHKYAIIDNTVWTGSFNFTKGGSNNQENAVIIKNSTHVTEKATTNFNLLWNRCSDDL